MLTSRTGETVAPDACVGLSFRANFDDSRKSPSMEIVRRVAPLPPDSNIVVAAPHENQLRAELAAIPNIRLVDTDAAIEAAQVVVLLVDHDKFREIEPAALQGKRIVDTRGFWQ